MSGLDDMWGGDEEEAPEEEPEKATKKGKKARPKKVKDTSAGFRMKLGICRRRGKEGKVQEMQILLAKDPMCWILRIGSSQTYPVFLSNVFETIAMETALELNSDAKIEDLIKDAKATEARIKEMGTILDKRIREFIVKKSKERK